jgi:hypothetical protein
MSMLRLFSQFLSMHMWTIIYSVRKSYLMLYVRVHYSSYVAKTGTFSTPNICVGTSQKIKVYLSSFFFSMTT